MHNLFEDVELDHLWRYLDAVQRGFVPFLYQVLDQGLSVCGDLEGLLSLRLILHDDGFATGVHLLRIVHIAPILVDQKR